MNRQLIDRILIAAGTVAGAIACVWWTNSILPLFAVVGVVFLATLQSRTDGGDALAKSENQTGDQRRTRRRDDE